MGSEFYWNTAKSCFSRFSPQSQPAKASGSASLVRGEPDKRYGENA
jgi:hypothetical protein